MYLDVRGLVLRETAYRDNDKLLTVLTAEHGRLTLKARGVRSRSSRLKSACQLLAFSEFTVFEQRGYHTINEAQPIEQFTGLRKDLDALSLASYLAQLGETLSDTDVYNPELLRVLLYALLTLSQQKQPLALVKAATELRLLCLSGFTPMLDGCPVCGSDTPDRFHTGLGLVHCAACKQELEPGISLPMPKGALEAMRYICAAPAEKLFRFTLPEEPLRQLGELCETYLLTQLQRGFSALDFYKSLQYQPDYLPKNPISEP